VFLKKSYFVTAVPKGKEYLTAKKRQYKYTNYLQYIGYLYIKFIKVVLINPTILLLLAVVIGT